MANLIHCMMERLILIPISTMSRAVLGITIPINCVLSRWVAIGSSVRVENPSGDWMDQAGGGGIYNHNSQHVSVFGTLYV